jgi:hypothetical protein
MSSPILHTLKLNLRISFDEDEFPYRGFADLVDTINLIHLPLLTTLNLSVDVDIEDPEPGAGDGYLDFLPTANFYPFLASHTTLLDLKLSSRGTKLKKEISYLPRLRSFEGSFEDTAVICDPQRPLEELILTVVHPMWLDDLSPSFRPIPLANHLSLTTLRVLAVDADGSAVKLSKELSPASFAQLASSFPNLTHLDVRLSDPMVPLLSCV